MENLNTNFEKILGHLVEKIIYNIHFYFLDRWFFCFCVPKILCGTSFKCNLQLVYKRKLCKIGCFQFKISKTCPFNNLLKEYDKPFNFLSNMR